MTATQEPPLQRQPQPANERLSILLCVIVAMIEGFDIQAAGVAAPSLALAFGLGSTQMGIIFSAATAGLALGAVFGGRLADFIGRKAVLLLSLALFGLASLATLAAQSYESLVLLRLATGAGLGGALPALIAIAAESASRGRVGSAVGMVYAGMPLGGAAAALTAALGVISDWKSVFLVGGIAPLLVIPVVAFLLPSKPVAKPPHDAKAAGRARWIGSLLGKGRAMLNLSLWMSFFTTLLVLYLLLNWMPALLVGSGFTKQQASVIQIVFNLAGAVGGVVVGRAMDGWPPKRVVLVTYCVLVAFLLALPHATSGMVVLAGVVALVGATLMGAQALLYGITPRLYSADLRATGIGAAVSAGRMGSIVGPLVAGGLIAINFGTTGLLSLLAPVVVVGGCLAWYVVRRIGSEV